MFDLTSSKLLILGVVALIVVGPKELPFLLRTIGKYVAMVRRHANDFRAQFDEAMREAELDGIKQELDKVARETENSIRDVHSSVERDINSAHHELEQSINTPVPEAPGQPASAESTVDHLTHDAAAHDHAYDAVNGVDGVAGVPSAADTPDAPLPAATPPPEAAPSAASPAAATPTTGHPAPSVTPAPATPELAKTGA